MNEKVIVIGGGYAGVMAANRAAGHGGSVALVNASATFVERIRLHEVAAGSRASAELPLSSMLHPDVDLVVGRAERIDAHNRAVLLADGREFYFDHLVYAVGSTSAQRPPQTFGIGSIKEALALRAHLMRTKSQSVDVIGAGLTGIELAAEIAFARPDLRVRLRTRGHVGPSLGATGGHAVRRRLERLGVQILIGDHGEVTADIAGTTVLAAGFGIPTLAHDSGLPVSADGRLMVGSDLTVPGHPEILGAGDAALVAGMSHLRMSCAAALPQGAHAVDTIFNGARPLSAGFMLQCVSLGRRDGWIQHVAPDDGPRTAHLSGIPGAIAKEAMSRQTVRWLRNEAAKPGTFQWPAGPSKLATPMDPVEYRPARTTD